MQVREIMTGNVTCVGPDTTLQQAAQKMRDLDVGSLPICDNDRLVGMITDRDIAIRAVADGREPSETRAADIMSEGVEYCFEDDDLEDAAQLMREKQIRRLIVLNHDKRLTGILALGDIAVTGDETQVGETLEEISEPAKPR
jgi:CBS domain-containing protein